MKSGLIAIFLLLGTVLSTRSGELPRREEERMDSMIRRELSARAFPGAAFLCGTADQTLYTHNYGDLDYTHTVPVTDSTLYDVASCTKVLSTTFVLMRLYDQKKISLERTVGEFLPRFAGTPLTTLTIQELLTHTSGLKPTVVYPDLIKPAHGGKLFNGHRNEQYPYLVDQNLYMVRNVVQDSVYLSGVPRPGYRQIADSLWVNPSVDTIMARKIIRSYDPGRRGRYLYNDTNMYLLRLIAERITGRTLEESTAELFAELGCTDTGYRPLEWTSRERIAPTENDKLLRRGPIQGFVHDELAAVSGGAGGNAGLFSTASDIARFCQMILNNGSYNGRQIITPATIDTFTSSPLSAKGIYRGLGFDKPDMQNTKKSPTCEEAPECVYGHTGYTGTAFWVDPENDLIFIFLSNRVYAHRWNTALMSLNIRPRIQSVIYQSIKD